MKKKHCTTVTKKRKKNKNTFVFIKLYKFSDKQERNIIFVQI